MRRFNPRTVGVEQVDLKAEATAAREAVEHALQWSIGHKPAVPILLAVDLHRRKPRWQGAAGSVCDAWRRQMKEWLIAIARDLIGPFVFSTDQVRTRYQSDNR